MDVKLFNDDVKFKFRVSAIIIDDEKLLIEQYTDDSYCLPGGYVEFNENTQNAIRRELYEETKMNFEIVDFCGVIENFFVNKKNVKTHEIDFYYYLKIAKNYTYEDLKLETIERGSYSNIKHTFKWIDIKKLTQYTLVPEEIKKIIIERSKSIHLIIEN